MLWHILNIPIAIEGSLFSNTARDYHIETELLSELILMAYLHQYNLIGYWLPGKTTSELKISGYSLTWYH